MTSLEQNDAPPSVTKVLRPGSYTAHRLQHATPDHIHLTTRRCFIGPIPEGWLKSHRKSWYGEYINLSNYSSRAATFSASPGVSQQKRITGLDGASSTAAFAPSFPQPRDVETNDEEDRPEDENSSDAVDQDSDEGDALTERSLEDARDGVQGLESETTLTQPHSVSRKKKWLHSQRHDPMFRKKAKATKATDASSFVTAPSQPSTSPQEQFRAKRRPSFVTALEPPDHKPDEPTSSSHKGVSGSSPMVSVRQDSGSNNSPIAGDGTDSRTSLLPHRENKQESNPGQDDSEPHESASVEDATFVPTAAAANHVSSGLVRFNLPTEVKQRGGITKPDSSQISRRRSWRFFRQGQAHPGEIVKTEKMLVRIDTAMAELPHEYDENASIKTSSRTLEKWREYVVVCRESHKDEESDFVIQLYKTRVIPAMENPHATKRCTHEIALLRKSTRVNLYSSLDKTLVMWLPWKGGTKIFLLRPRSSSSSVEWYTFLRHALGWKRSQDLQVNVPDLSVTLQVIDPFTDIEAARAAASKSSGDEAALVKTMEAEKAVANVLIQRCVGMLHGSKEWSEVLKAWSEHEKMGLAWKRYDRLEWVHGANEQRMYGTLAMQKSHELELRPKKHYSTNVKPSEQPAMDEPPPVEGFLIRLTSQRGRVQRLGKMFFKRLYFFTHDHYLCYCRPAKALPPPPPKTSLAKTSNIPSASEIIQKTPIVYAVNPYPLKDGKIGWLSKGTAVSIERADEEAYTEAERRTNSLLNAEGYINICQIIRVRKVHRGSTPADANVDYGSDVDFHEAVSDSRQDDGKTDVFDDDRTFELVLNNGLVIRLQAYNKETNNEWMTRLRKLVEYWKLRTADDMTLLKSVRQANLETLGIDEEMEAHLGQFAEKWEVSRAVASPYLFNICGISCCRAITMSGVLYRKPRKHTTFLKCGVILAHGALLIFHGTLRKRTGEEIPHIQHERQTTIDLKNCYIYSGLVTEGDLLYQNRTFDSNHPGHSALPRIYTGDGWTSTDEDTMTTFVIWQVKSRSFFKANDETEEGGTRRTLRYVSRLGVPGRSMVFKARSRAERDHWVMSVGMEIERLQGGEEVRVVEK
ncbi:MAG: hypothetical protein LQ352_004160 [Teloschistes flavicans]|nr:MAG: hypothetical protein LQ352_004160 [Teloschistes flavicans]